MTDRDIPINDLLARCILTCEEARALRALASRMLLRLQGYRWATRGPAAPYR
jgi:hypothetical protein